MVTKEFVWREELVWRDELVWREEVVLDENGKKGGVCKEIRVFRDEDGAGEEDVEGREYLIYCSLLSLSYFSRRCFLYAT